MDWTQQHQDKLLELEQMEANLEALVNDIEGIKGEIYALEQMMSRDTEVQRT